MTATTDQVTPSVPSVNSLNVASAMPPVNSSPWAILRAAIVSFTLLTVLTGLVYPLAITLVGKLAFSHQAQGSLIDRSGQFTNDESAAVGSSLIGQSFDQPQYFWSRPSATTPQPYNAASSSGSNIGPSAIADTVKQRVDALRRADPENKDPIPVDLVTASASGLDPGESIAAAEYQVARIARIRRVSQAQLRLLIATNTNDRSLGFLGEKTVNVLKLNLALDKLAPYAQPATSTRPVVAKP